MKSKTAIIILLLAILLSLLVYFIIRSNNDESVVGESSSTGEASPVVESSPICEVSPTGEGTTLITSERRDKPTPNGGDYSEIFYFDDDGNSVDKTVATKAVVKEYKNDGTLINEIFADINR